MSGHPQLSPYLNRFTTLWQDKADVKLEFTCKDGNVIVNLSHNLGSIVKVTEEVKTQSPNSGNILKKNVSLSQIVRLKKRAAERATAEKLEAEQVKATSPRVIDESAQGRQVEAESSPAAKAKDDAEKAKDNAVEANVTKNAKIESEKSEV